MQRLKRVLRLMINSILIVGMVFMGIYIQDNAKEINLSEALNKSHPFKKAGKVVCSSSQIEHDGKRFTLTNKHCCKALESYDIKGNLESAIGKVVNIGNDPKEILHISKKHDMCLLEPLKNSPAFSLADGYNIMERIIVIGHPRGTQQTLREGRVIAHGRLIFDWISPEFEVPYSAISALGYPGNSGSPVVNLSGELAGLVFGGYSGIHTELFMLPARSIKDFIEELK